MKRTAVTSKQIAAIGYNPATKELDLEFVNHSKTPRPPSVYRYANVTPDDHTALMGAESIGKHFGATIKSQPEKFPFRRLTDEEARS